MLLKLSPKTILVSMIVGASALSWPTAAHGAPRPDAEQQDNSEHVGNSMRSNDPSAAAAATAPSILVDNVADPPSLPEPGGAFTVNVVVTNTGGTRVTITRLTDSVYGDISTQGTCTTAVGATMEANGSSYSCAFTGEFFGNAGARLFHTVTAQAVDDFGAFARDGDVGVMELTDVAPTVTIDNTATPVDRPEPGGQFSFAVVVTNTSAEQVTITALTDDVYGNIASQGTCTTAVGTALAAGGGTYSCSYPGNFSGNAGASQSSVSEVRVVDDDRTGSSATDSAVVTLTDVAPTVTIDNTATPVDRPEPGGQFSFAVVVTNTSAEQVTITALTDDVYGNIASQGTCTTAVGTALAAGGGTYSCSYTGNFSGNGGASQTNVVEVTVVDDDGTSGSDDDETVVALTSATTPTVRIGDVSVAEGDRGTTSAVFTLSLSSAQTQPVTLNYTTANGTATGGIDFASAAGSVTFAAGQTSQSIAIAVTGDKRREPDETYFVRLSGPTDGVGFDEEAVGTIVNDDRKGTCSKHARHKRGCSPRCARAGHQNNGRGNGYGWSRCHGNHRRPGPR